MSLTISPAEKAKIINALKVNYQQALDTDKIKTWLSNMRSATGLDWLNSGDIKEKFNVYYLKYMGLTFLNAASSMNIFNYVDTDTKVYSMLKAMRINVDATPETKVAVNGDVTDAKIDASVEKYLTTNGIKLEVQSSLKSIEKDFAAKATALETKVTSEIDASVKAAVQALRPVHITLINNKVVVLEKRLHMAFARCLTFANRYRQVYIAGPAGTGKTTLAEQVAEAMDLPFAFISCNIGLSSAQLLGRMDAHGNYIAADFVTLYENGGVFLFDEVDAADANTMLTINSALANGLLAVPNRKEKGHARRHKDFICICAANTWGHGSADYVGRNQLDAAFLDRFSTSRLTVGYDTDLEGALSATHPRVAEIVWKIRNNVVTQKMKKVVSTRAIINGVIAITDGDSYKMFVDDLTCGWSAEETKKALAGITL